MTLNLFPYFPFFFLYIFPFYFLFLAFSLKFMGIKCSLYDFDVVFF